jgi:UDP-3-O-[3-hydroxymyristoyl] glucosamine N-acyltransferase
MPEKVAVRLEDIQQRIGGDLHGSGGISVTGVNSLDEAGPGDLAYVSSDRYIARALKSRAAAFVTHRAIPELDRPQLVVPHPAFAFAQLTQACFLPGYRARGVANEVIQGSDVEIGAEPSIWPFVTIGDRVRLGARVTLYPGVFLGADVTVGDDTVLFPNVTVLDGCQIGARVRVHSGSVVGSDGFGYVQHGGRHHKIPQIGTVVIEDDVELGANVTVDRATFGQTVVKRGTKVDNLVQIAHNVTVGEDCILVAQVGIAGSTTIGHHVMVGGQAGIGDHLHIGDMTMIAARSGVAHHLTSGQIVSGNPAIPHAVSLKALAVVSHLPDLRDQVRRLERRLGELEQQARSKGHSHTGKRHEARGTGARGRNRKNQKGAK